jgi:hypothetical protein
MTQDFNEKDQATESNSLTISTLSTTAVLHGALWPRLEPA